MRWLFSVRRLMDVFLLISLMISEIVVKTVPLTTDAQGVIRLKGTRIPIDTVIEAFDEGATAEEIVQQYPTLRLADVYDVIGYYLSETATIKDYLEKRKKTAEQVKNNNQSLFPAQGIRERLLMRRRENK